MSIIDGMLSISGKHVYDLTARFFESAAETSNAGWQSSYERMSDIIAAGPGSIHFRRKKDNYFDPIANSNEPGFVDRFNALYWHLLPFQEKFVSLRAGDKFLRTRDCPDDEYVDSEIYQDHFKKLGIYEVLHYCLFDDDRYAAGITFTRPQEKGRFTQHEEDFVAEMVPHIQRATRLHLRILEANHENRILMEAWNRIPEGVILVSQNSVVTFQNQTAEEILEAKAGLKITRKGIIGCGSAKESSELQELIRSVFENSANNCRGLGGQFYVSRTKGKSPLSISVTPFKESDRHPMGSERFAMLLITDPDSTAASTEGELIKTYGLTKAEARFAKLIADGHNLSVVGEILGITQNTARTHLKRVFGKTATNRQGALVKLLLSKPYASRI